MDALITDLVLILCKHVHIAQHVMPGCHTARLKNMVLRWSGVALKNLTSYGKTMLQDIIAKKDTLKLHGM